MFDCSKVYGKDKGCHFIGGVLITLVAYMLFGDVVAILAGAYAGLLKEAYDEWDYKGADYFDFFFTLFGMGIGILTMGLFNVDPINNVVVHVPYLIGIFAVFCLAVWYLFSTKMRAKR